jgi:hypothetical protein
MVCRSPQAARSQQSVIARTRRKSLGSFRRLFVISRQSAAFDTGERRGHRVGTQSAACNVAHVKRSNADLRRGGHRRGRAAAGVSDCTNPLRRDRHTKVYCGRSEEVMRPHARVMEEPTQIADCHAAQRRGSGPALFSDEHRTWQVYHARSRFSLRWVPHADSG